MKKAFLNLFTAEGRRHEVPTSKLLFCPQEADLRHLISKKLGWNIVGKK
jgi:hypothetical protein